MRRLLALAAALAMALPAAASADVTARYTISPPPPPAAAPAGATPATPPNPPQEPPVITVSVGAGGQARVGAKAGDQDVALINREGVGYVVAQMPQGPIVARQEDVLGMVSQMAGMMPNREGVTRAAARRAEVVERGSETVAGIRGTLYAVTIIDGQTRQPPMEIVISTDPALAPVGREFVRLFDSARGPIAAMMGAEPQLLTALRELLGRGTPIRVGAALRLASVSADPVPASTFALPGPVMTREQLQQMAAMMGAGRAPAPSAPAVAPTPAPNHDGHDGPHPH